MSTRPDDPDATYLPARYRQQVLAKKQHRIYKKLLTSGIVIVVLIIVFFLLIGMLPVPQSSTLMQRPVTPTPSMGGQNPAPVVNVTVAVTPGYVTGTGLLALHSTDMLPLDKAVSFLREEYPAETYTLNNLNLTDRYSGHMLYEFTIQPAVSSLTETPFVIFSDALTGEPYTPGQEDARIKMGNAQDLARKAFLGIRSDKVLVRYSADPDSGRTWNFRFVKDTTPVLTGTIDAETGLISSFAQTIQTVGRPTEPVTGLPAAQKIADRYISGKNGPVAVNMSIGRYFSLGSPSDPVAGQYVFIYNRIVNNIPCEADGFIVSVDSLTGEITAYERHWRAPDNAFSVASDALVLKREATYTILKRAQETYPESVNGLRIVSAEIKWKDQHPIGVTPRPGSIPLAWKVTFDDEIIRANNSAKPAIAWLDAQTMGILDFEYRH
ncbi:MAG: hypothetical protein Q7U51_04585 [Methanoregula sp.]|nr:hypothetical protein [Methanoregula sp.]